MNENELDRAKNYKSLFPIDKIRYANTLPIIRNIPREIESRGFYYPDRHLEGLVKHLINGKNDVLFKTKIIHDWIADNIYYDLDAYHSNSQEADVKYDEVLKSKRTICEGYANLYKKMCEYAGVEVLKIGGIAKGLDPLGSHSWNGIKINSKWYIIDVTWDSQNVYENKKYNKNPFKTSYLFLEPKYAIYDHFPNNEIYQFVDNPISKAKFKTLPKKAKISYITSDFYKHNLKLLSSLSPQIELDGEPSYVTFEAPEKLLLGAGAVSTGDVYITHYCFLQKFGSKYVLHINPAKQNEYFVDVFIKKSQKTIFSVGVTTKSNLKNDYSFPQLYKEYLDNNMCLYSPVKGTLKLNQTYNFKIHSPQDNEIYIVTPKEQFIPMEKNSSNIYYLDNYKVSEFGNIFIAKLNSSTYHMLIKFSVI